jgi:aquaporin Z
MYKKLLAELIGTFVLVSVILAIVKSKLSICETGLSIGAALAVAIFMMGQVSGGHFNPVVSLVMLADKQMKIPEFLQYTGAQA